MIFAQCHTNRNYIELQILSVICYMLYQTDLIISLNINALKQTLKSIAHTAGGGGAICINFIKCILKSEYVSISSNAYSDLYDIYSK